MCGDLNLSNLNLIQLKVSPTATFQVINSYIWLLAAIQGSTDREHFHYLGVFSWTDWSVEMQMYQAARGSDIYPGGHMVPGRGSTDIYSANNY